MAIHAEIPTQPARARQAREKLQRNERGTSPVELKKHHAVNLLSLDCPTGKYEHGCRRVIISILKA